MAKDKEVEEANNNVNSQYAKVATMSKEDFVGKYKVTEKGLSSNEATKRISAYGENIIKKARPKRWYNYFFESLFSAFNSILLGIAIVLCYTDIYLADEPSYANIIVIIILVIVSTLLDFIEEYRSNKAAEKLKEMVATTTTVIRDGKESRIPVKDVTVGDVIKLSAGDMIPADLRIIESKDLYVGQSSLTGESDSVEKNVESKIAEDEIESIVDLNTICFMGTNVISGSAKGVVVYTADDTYFGKVAHTLTGKEKSDFQKGTENISKLLIKLMIILIPIVFMINAGKHETVMAFTFAVAVAICITPLLLPVILSSSLSKGAVRMSKKKTIVKKLDSIQSFGAMNILCTDKTGTLTEDKIVLEKYLDVKGAEDLGVLKHAFLNAYFQTGLKGNIDEAVIERALKNDMSGYTKTYKKVDEIPFDFTRRRLSVVVEGEGEKLLITKGAVEEILSICTRAKYKDQILQITNDAKEHIREMTKTLNKDGLRVVAVCVKKDKEIENISSFSVSDEKDMVLIGFIGFLDPPKESAKEAIERMNKSGIRVMVLTGDNVEVTNCICKKVGINSNQIVTGSQLDKMSDLAVKRVLKKTNIFAKLSPIQKARVVRILKDAGNVVGYMGDGINDSPSLINSDVGISVDTGADIAKESADIILLEKDLNVLLDGVTEGRKTFANLMKYIKMAVSFNFGEVVSVIIASIFLPFLPETPIQLLVESLLYDFGQLTLPFDNVDKEYLKKPRKWDIKGLKRFTLFMGPVSSCFDILVFLSLWFGFGLRGADVALFQTVWFSYSIISNLIGMHIIRTSKLPFIQSRAHKAVYASSILLCITALIVPSTILGEAIGLVVLPTEYIGLIFGVTALYCVVALVAKKIYMSRNNGEWI